MSLVEAVNHLLDETGRLLRTAPRQQAHVADKVDETGRQSLVTTLDIKVEEILVAGLRRLSGNAPEVAFFAEERFADPAALKASRCWVIDPLDCTRLYLAGRPGYATNVALVQDGEITHGWTDLPAWGARLVVTPEHVTFNGHPVTQAAPAEPTRLHVAVNPLRQHHGLPRYVGDGRRLITVPCSGVSQQLLRLVRGEVDASMVSPGSRFHLWDLASAMTAARRIGMAMCSWGQELDLADLLPSSWPGGYVAARPADRALLREALPNEIQVGAAIEREHTAAPSD